MPGLLDVILGYDCNLACDYCTITEAMRERALETGPLLATMRRARGLDYDRIAFTGGEPTLRRDLVGLDRSRPRSIDALDREAGRDGLRPVVVDEADQDARRVGGEEQAVAAGGLGEKPLERRGGEQEAEDGNPRREKGLDEVGEENAAGEGEGAMDARRTLGRLHFAVTRDGEFGDAVGALQTHHGFVDAADLGQCGAEVLPDTGGVKENVVFALPRELRSL